MHGREPFKPGDIIHVPKRFRTTDVQTGRVGRNPECQQWHSELLEQATIVSVENQLYVYDDWNDKVKDGSTQTAYILTSSGILGWTRLTCCVKRFDDDGTSWLHKVVHVRIFKNMRDNWSAEDWFGFVMGLGAIFLVCVGLSCLVAAIRSEGHIDYCYVQWVGVATPGEHERYVVTGHISWAHDRTLGSAPTPEEAQVLMNNVCPVGAKK